MTAAVTLTGIRTRASGILVLIALVAALATLTIVAVRGNPAPGFSQQVQQIAGGLHCPICKDLSVAESPAPLAQEMRQEIAQQLRAGESADQIRAGFVASYGDSVLMSPPDHGLAGVAYYLPWLVGAVGVAAAFFLVRRWLRAARSDPPEDGSTYLSESQLRAVAKAVAQLRVEEPG